MIFNIHIEYYELNVLYVYVIDNRYAYLYAYTQHESSAPSCQSGESSRFVLFWVTTLTTESHSLS